MSVERQFTDVFFGPLTWPRFGKDIATWVRNSENERMKRKALDLVGSSLFGHTGGLKVFGKIKNRKSSVHMEKFCACILPICRHLAMRQSIFDSRQRLPCPFTKLIIYWWGCCRKLRVRACSRAAVGFPISLQIIVLKI